MNNFEEITKNPETLGAFLRGLPVIEAPWDEEFQRKYCAGCGKVSCDDGSPCPYEDKRNNPLWWLLLRRHDEELLDEIDERERQRQDDERRRNYD